MAEQQLRKSAEVRLGNEMRKSYKLTAYNNEIAMANTKLQRQLKEARTEVCSRINCKVSIAITPDSLMCTCD